MTESGLPPAGWHPDPERPGQERFWDGAQWTDQRRPMAPMAPAPVAPQAPTPYRTAAPKVGFVPTAMAWIRRHPKLSGVIGVVALLVIIGGLSGSPDDSSKTDDTAASVAPAVTITPSPTASASATTSSSPSATPKPTPTKPPTLIEQVRSAVEGTSATKPTVRPFNGGMLVTWEMSDAFTNGQIQGLGASDAFDMAEAISKLDQQPAYVTFRGTFPLQDKFGKVFQAPVMVFTLTRPTIDRIRYDNVDHTSTDLLRQLARGGLLYLHPAIQD